MTVAGNRTAFLWLTSNSTTKIPLLATVSLPDFRFSFFFEIGDLIGALGESRTQFFHSLMKLVAHRTESEAAIVSHRISFVPETLQGFLCVINLLFCHLAWRLCLYLVVQPLLLRSGVSTTSLRCLKLDRIVICGHLAPLVVAIHLRYLLIAVW